MGKKLKPFSLDGLSNLKVYSSEKQIATNLIESPALYKYRNNQSAHAMFS